METEKYGNVEVWKYGSVEVLKGGSLKGGGGKGGSVEVAHHLTLVCTRHVPGAVCTTVQYS